MYCDEHGTIDYCPECIKEKSQEHSRSAVVVDRPESEIDIQHKYNELIMAVIRKYPGESRHDTALRYIKERENRKSETAKVESEE